MKIPPPPSSFYTTGFLKYQSARESKDGKVSTAKAVEARLCQMYKKLRNMGEGYILSSMSDTGLDERGLRPT